LDRIRNEIVEPLAPGAPYRTLGIAGGWLWQRSFSARGSGFALQRVYTDDLSLDETMAVSDRDVVLVPKGYHPVGAPHGFDLYYLNVMAGPVRQWRFTMAPDHAFLTF